jgi:hypothetical protein
MKYTNKYKLPEFVANALMHSDYAKVGEFSATGLIKSPRQRILADRHADEIIMDVSENTYSVLGTAVHKAFEIRGSAENVIAEGRMAVHVQTKFGDVTISGQPDLVDLETKTLWDYKCTSVWAFMLGGKPEWEKQLNIYRWMLSVAKDIQIDTINVLAVYRDWRRSDYEAEYKKNPFECRYPECNIGVISIPVLPLEGVERNVIKLIERHKEQELKSDDMLMLCSDEERWARGACWAVKKKGGKRALSGGLHDSEADAIKFANKQAFPTEIERRTGKNTKCESYCLAAPFCNQWKAIQNEAKEEG